jgi:dihydrofolate synthase/folylpolyglutamate synthase
MHDYGKTVKYLYDLQLFGIKLGLKNIRLLLDSLGNPENYFPSIHIAGTNGKGSTASMIASILTASGYRTGLYTSPHLVDFSERIRINGKKISHDDIFRYTTQLRPWIDRYKATFFEATTAIAFQYFRDKNVDIAIVETGLGGRCDATNILAPLLTIITNIDLEHTEHLGKTYSSIAYEKGGIIKPFTPCLTGTTNRESLECLNKIAKYNQSRIIKVDSIVSVCVQKESLEGLNINLATGYEHYNNLFVSLAGEHQAKNVSMAIVAIEHLKHHEKYSKITTEKIKKGLSFIQKYSGLRGRLDILNRSPLIIGDVAHNPAGIKILVNSLSKIIVSKCVIIFGVMRDKSYSEMIKLLKSVSRIAIAVAPNTERALDSKIIADEFQKLSIPVLMSDDVKKGLKMAKLERRQNEPIIAVGSHYLVGELIKMLKI